MEARALDTFDLSTYLQLESESDTKYEFYNGYILAMAGGTPRHGLIGGNFLTALNIALRAAGKSCKVYSSDVKVAIAKANQRFYPDVSVVCGPVAYDDTEPRALTNPMVIVEVLSDTTEALDRGNKFRGYRQLESLREYILVSQDRALVEVFSRAEEGVWRIQTALGMDGAFELPSLDIQLLNSEVYLGVEDLQTDEPSL
ncbi:MAG: Uma2 family endonuclease [Bacteroidia bacterium]|nr:Uma2 family endonuclease [Bacteroidia bacterium]